MLLLKDPSRIRPVEHSLRTGSVPCQNVHIAYAPVAAMTWATLGTAPLLFSTEQVVDTTDAGEPPYRGIPMPRQLLEQEELKREDVLSERDEALAQVIQHCLSQCWSYHHYCIKRENTTAC